MKRRILTVLMLSSAAGFVPSANTPTAEAAPQKLYLLIHENGSENRVFQYQVAANGTLTLMPGSPVDTLNTDGAGRARCQTMAYSARRKLLFTGGGNGISVTDFATLPPKVVTGSPFGNQRIRGVAVVEKGRSTFVYGADFDAHKIRGFRLTSGNTLEPLPGSPFAAYMNPNGILAKGDNLFVANIGDGFGGAVGAYKVAADGALTPAPRSPYYLTFNSAYSIDIDPTGKFVYAAAGTRAQVYGFRRAAATAALTPIAGSPFSMGVITRSGLAFASPSVLFTTADTFDFNLQTWSKRPTGALKPSSGHTTSLLSRPDVVAVDPAGRILAVVNGISDKIVTERIVSPRGAVSGLQVFTQSMGAVTAMLFIKR